MTRHPQPAPLTPTELLERLEQLGISTKTVTHPPVFTVDEAKALRREGGADAPPGGHIKNLFLRNKKGRMWLLAFSEDRILDLKSLAEALGAKRFSFASKERLMRCLGVIPGAVTPFGVINDQERAVCMVLDAELLTHESIFCHPLVNTMTTAIAPSDLLDFIRRVHAEPTVLDLDEFELAPNASDAL